MDISVLNGCKFSDSQNFGGWLAVVTIVVGIQCLVGLKRLGDAYKRYMTMGIFSTEQIDVWNLLAKKQKNICSLAEKKNETLQKLAGLILHQYVQLCKKTV